MRIQILVLRFKELMKNLKWNTWNISPSPFGDSCRVNRGTQRQFLENICSENDLISRIFGTFQL